MLSGGTEDYPDSRTRDLLQCSSVAKLGSSVRNLLFVFLSSLLQNSTVTEKGID